MEIAAENYVRRLMDSRSQEVPINSIVNVSVAQVSLTYF